MVRMRMVVMRSEGVPMTGVAGDLLPPAGLLEHTTPTSGTTASRVTRDPGKTRKAGSPNEPANGTIDKSATSAGYRNEANNGTTGKFATSAGYRNEANDGTTGKSVTRMQTVRRQSPGAAGLTHVRGARASGGVPSCPGLRPRGPMAAMQNEPTVPQVAVAPEGCSQGTGESIRTEESSSLLDLARAAGAQRGQSMSRGTPLTH
jgi:hypothetical protein